MGEPDKDRKMAIDEDVDDQEDVEDESRMDEFDDLLSQITIGTEATVEWSSPNASGLQSRRGKVLKVGQIDDDYAPTGTPWIEVEDPERDDRNLIIWPAWDDVRGTYEDDNERALGDLQDLKIHNEAQADQKDVDEAPSSMPKYIREGLEKQSSEDLRAIAAYATELANEKEREAEHDLKEQADQDVDETPEEWDEEDWEDELEKAREKAEVPESKGALTTKTIDGRDYYYLQWREGSKIESKYVAPVVPADSG